MSIETYHYSYHENTKEWSWDKEFDPSLDSESTLVLAFGELGSNPQINQALEELCYAFPHSLKMGCSSAGEILGESLYEHSLVVALLRLEKSHIKRVESSISSAEESYEIGQKIGKELAGKDLRVVLILSEGLIINGSALSEGIEGMLPSEVIISGGLAADMDRFERTFLIDAGCQASSQIITAVGLYGASIRVASSFKGGWDRFGIERKITSSKGNILYTLNGEPALEVYRRYLGKYADSLPASALLFPLAIREEGSDEIKVRTVLGIDEKRGAITFAGDLPEGSYASLMKGNFDRLIDAAFEAAEKIVELHHPPSNALCIAISCVGRKLLLKQRIEEELEAILEALPPGVTQIGYYSYGEISPTPSHHCDLHNQTMTLTLIWEE